MRSFAPFTRTSTPAASRMPVGVMNGSGKSSVCEGLEHVLLGSVQEAESRRIQERRHFTNLHAGRFDVPILTALDQGNREVRVEADPDKFRFSVVEKNRIDAFSRLAARPTGSRTELIAAPFGMDDFNDFVTRFNDSIDSQLILSGAKQYALTQLRAGLADDHNIVNGEAEAIGVLAEEEATLADSYSAGTTYDQLQGLFGTPESPSRLQALNNAINAIPPA